MGDCNLRKLPAPARAPVDARGLRLQRHRVNDQSSALVERIVSAIDHAWRAGPAADEDRIWPRQFGEGTRRLAGDHRQAGNAEAQRVARNAVSTILTKLNRHCAVSRIAENPFD